MSLLSRPKSFTMSSMKNQEGAVSALLISTIVLSVFLVGAVVFGVWAFMGRQDYKDNVDQKIVVATKVSDAKLSAQKDKEFAEKEKSPYKTYEGPSAFGSLKIVYPKTWNAYVDETPKGSVPVDAYFMPVFVPGVGDNASYALRAQVVNGSYSNEVNKFSGNVKAGKTTASPFIPPKVPTVTGTRFDGLLTNNKAGSMVILPLRDKAIRIWTEVPEFTSDYNNIILPNFTFVQ